MTLASPLAHAYSSADTDRAQAVVVPEYGNVTESQGSITAPAWDGNTGGILALIASSTMRINDANGITMAGKGYVGGTSSTLAPSGGPRFTQFKMPGGSYVALGVSDGLELYKPNKGGGGGGGMRVNCAGSPGGGGGHAVPGIAGGLGGGCAGGTIFGGFGGEAYGDAALEHMFFGSGGGAGGFSSDPTAGRGGAGGGIVILYTSSIDVHAPGAVNVDGAPGTRSVESSGAPGGGGAGGSIYLSHTSTVTGFSNLSANGAAGGAAGTGPDEAKAGGSGGSGRIAVIP